MESVYQIYVVYDVAHISILCDSQLAEAGNMRDRGEGTTNLWLNSDKKVWLATKDRHLDGDGDEKWYWRLQLLWEEDEA